MKLPREFFVIFFEIFCINYSYNKDVCGPKPRINLFQGLYTYNVREGDYFVIDEKAALKPVRTQRSVSLQFGTSPRTPTSPNPRPGGR